MLAALDQIQLQREGKISPPPIAISRNVQAAVDRARQQEEADGNDLLLANDDVLGGQEEDDDLDLLLEDDDSDTEGNDSAGINLDEYFQRERQLAAAQRQQQPARARRR